jgi:hypothetical protein
MDVDGWVLSKQTLFRINRAALVACFYHDCYFLHIILSAYFFAHSIRKLDR